MKALMILLGAAGVVLVAVLVFWAPATGGGKQRLVDVNLAAVDTQEAQRLIVREAQAHDAKQQRANAQGAPGETSAVSPEPSAEAGSLEVVPNEHILSFFNEADKAAFMRLARERGVDILGDMRLGHSVRIRVTGAKQYRDLLEDSPHPVASAENSYVRIPADPSTEPRTSDGRYVGFSDRLLEWLGADGDTSQWGKGVTVAVLDTAVGKHDAIPEANIRRVNPLGLEMVATDTHGTSVASLIIGQGDGVSGLAPAAKVLSIPVISSGDAGDAYSLAQGITEAVTLGADIINLSLGSDTDNFIVRAAIQHARDNGVAVVAAVGNGAVDGVTFPARLDGVLAVGGVDAAGRHLYFSNTGSEVDIVAPGLALNAAGPDNTTITFSGTSAATPIVSGAIAAVMSLSPGLTADQAAQLLVSYGDDNGAPGSDLAYGGGFLNMGRLIERDVPNIYDVTAGGPFIIDPQDGSQDLIVEFYAQNRGTESIGDLTMNVVIDGVPTTLHFSDIVVGQTVSEQVIVPAVAIPPDGIVVAAHEAVIEGEQDANPSDNGQRSVFTLNPDADTP